MLTCSCVYLLSLSGRNQKQQLINTPLCSLSSLTLQILNLADYANVVQLYSNYSQILSYSAHLAAHKYTLYWMQYF